MRLAGFDTPRRRDDEDILFDEEIDPRENPILGGMELLTPGFSDTPDSGILEGDFSGFTPGGSGSEIPFQEAGFGAGPGDAFFGGFDDRDPSNPFGGG